MLTHIENKTVPRCIDSSCNGLVKPKIVFFGEQLPREFFDNIDLGPGAGAWLPPVAPRAYASTVHIGDEAGGREAVGTAADAVRLPLPGGWVATAWGAELHRVVTAAEALTVPVGRATA